MTEKADNQKQQFTLGDFEGPLDLLLFLIKKNEINIYDIPVAEITEQYLEYLKFATKVDLDNITEFYVLAATLLFIKSRMLLPGEISMDEDMEDPRLELVEKLIDYQKYKKLSEIFMQRERETEWVIEREKKQQVLPFPDEEIWQQISVWDLLTTFSQIISSIAPEKIIDLYEPVTINEKIALVNEFLEQRSEIRFADLIVHDNSLMEIICSFLALLEMVKAKQIIAYQNKLFGDIRIKKRVKD
jgi:segregation and condensation protein A